MVYVNKAIKSKQMDKPNTKCLMELFRPGHSYSADTYLINQPYFASVVEYELMPEGDSQCFGHVEGGFHWVQLGILHGKVVTDRRVDHRGREMADQIVCFL